jgi:hypothetical protein
MNLLLLVLQQSFFKVVAFMIMQLLGPGDVLKLITCHFMEGNLYKYNIYEVQYIIILYFLK